MRLLTLKSILIATDLDEASKPALRTGARLAQLADARLHLLHVARDTGKDATARLEAHFRAVTSDDAAPDTVDVVSGTPAAAIVAFASKVGADAVILGPHRGAGTNEPMGSTAAEVVRTAPCPCLVAAVDLRLPLERVLTPVDLSEISGGALAVALTWASALRPRGGHAHITALHVADAPGAGPQALHEEVERVRARTEGAARVEIHEHVAAATDAAHAIIENAASASADLLVMGTGGAAGADSIGRVSAQVARATPCPLLLVPAATWKAYREDVG